MFGRQKFILRVEGSTFCNQKCLFCPQPRCKLRKQVMPMSMFRNIVDAVHNQKLHISIVNFSGMGEPLTDPYLFERVKYAQKISKRFSLYTNGSLLKGETLQRVNDAFTKVFFSFHGNTAAEYEQFTGNNFEEMKIIFQEAKRVLGSKLVLSNHPEGKLHSLLGAGDISLSDLHPIHNFGDAKVKADLKKIGVNAAMNGQRYCELNLFIIFRVDGSFATCCNDWDNENNILNGRFPKCKRCFSADHFQEMIKDGSLSHFSEKVKALQKELRSVQA